MAAFLNPLKVPAMLRHSLGFGIHSPFAFGFILDVLRLPRKYGYYAYDMIAGTRNRQLYRISLVLGGARIAVYAGADMAAAVRQACPASRLVEKSPDFVVADFDVASEADFEAVCACISAGVPAVIFNYGGNAALRAVRRAMPSGMTFANGTDKIVAVPSGSLPRQDFNLFF